MAFMTQKINAWKKLKKAHKLAIGFFFIMLMDGVTHGTYDSAFFYALLIFIYWTRVTMDPAELKKAIAARARYRSSSSDPQDLSNPSGFTNPTSPMYHMHNSPSISSSFDTYRG